MDPGVENATFSHPTLGWKGQHPYPKVQAVFKYSLECLCFGIPGENEAEKARGVGAEMGDTHVPNGPPGPRSKAPQALQLRPFSLYSPSQGLNLAKDFSSYPYRDS